MAELYEDIVVGCQSEAPPYQVPVKGLKAVAAAFAGWGLASPFAVVRSGLVDRHLPVAAEQIAAVRPGRFPG